MSYRREIPKLNRDNFAAWEDLMNLHLETINDLGLKYINTTYKAPTTTMTIEEIVEKKNHNIMMIDIASTLNYVEFDEVKGCATTHDMWTKLKDIYGGDDNVKRSKEESFKDQFDQMKMREHENIANLC